MTAFSSPRVPPSSPDEREVLLGYLHWKREQIVASTEGLDEDQARWTPDGKLVPLIGVVNHLAHVEWRWIEGRYLATPFPPRTEEWQVPRDRSLDEVVGAYWKRAQRTADVVRAAPSLDEPCVGVEGEGKAVHEIFRLPEPVSLRWVLLHLVEETAHHAGHADATREMLDGRRAND